MAARKDTHSRGLLKRGHGGLPQERKSPSSKFRGGGQFIRGIYMALLIPMRMSHQFMGYAVMKPQIMLICIMSQKTG